MVVSLSEEQALYYLKQPNGADSLMNGYIQFLKNIEDEYGFKGLEVNLHTDEGYYDTKGNVKYNIHAHIIFLNYDFTQSKTVLKKLNKSDWSYMQDIASQSFQTHNLDFIRGEQKLTDVKDHLERNDFILQKQNFELQNQIYEQELNKQTLSKQINTSNKNKNILKQQRAQFNRTSQEYKELTPKFNEAKKQEKELREKRKQLEEIIIRLKEEQDEQLQKAQIEQNKINKEISQLKKAQEQHSSTINYQTNTIDSLYEEKDSIVEANTILEDQNKKLETKINTTKQKSIQAINKSVKVLQEATKKDNITFTKTAQQELAKHNNYLIELQENKDLKIKNADRINDIQKLIKQNKALQTKNKTLTTENQDLQIKNNELEDQVKIKQSYIDNLIEIVEKVTKINFSSLAQIFKKFLPDKKIDFTNIDD